MLCHFGDNSIDVYSLKPCKGGLISVTTKYDDKTAALIYLPFEKFHFSIEISDSKSDEPPREIEMGFHTLWAKSATGDPKEIIH